MVQGPDCLREALAAAVGAVDRLAEAVHPEEPQPKPVAPIQLRAQAARQQARDLEAVRASLEARENDIVALKKALKIKVCAGLSPCRRYGWPKGGPVLVNWLPSLPTCVKELSWSATTHPSLMRPFCLHLKGRICYFYRALEILHILHTNYACFFFF